MRMHADEVDIDVDLVRRLVAAQFPRWAKHPILRVESAGTDNAMFRLGADLAVRLPRTAEAEAGIVKEVRWVPELAAKIRTPVPIPVGRGEPGEGFAWQWCVQQWLPGSNPVVGELADPSSLVVGLATFIRSLRKLSPAGAPAAGRGVPLSDPARNAATREAINALEGEIDAVAATLEWARALAAPAWEGPPTWFHGDLTPGNLLTDAGRLAGVIDFATAGVGDPAVDLLPAWNLLPAASRDRFRSSVGADDAMWARGRGWALSIALIALPYYRDTNPALVANSRHVLAQLLGS